eukprot:g34929.t1
MVRRYVPDEKAIATNKWPFREGDPRPGGTCERCAGASGLEAVEGSRNGLTMCKYCWDLVIHALQTEARQRNETVHTAMFLFPKRKELYKTRYPYRYGSS